MESREDLVWEDRVPASNVQHIRMTVNTIIERNFVGIEREAGVQNLNASASWKHALSSLKLLGDFI